MLSFLLSNSIQIKSKKYFNTPASSMLEEKPNLTISQARDRGFKPGLNTLRSLKFMTEIRFIYE